MTIPSSNALLGAEPPQMHFQYTSNLCMPRAADEPVRLTRIYTRGGDAGETSLGDGSRVSKLDSRIAAFGTTDDLNSLLGVVLAGDCPSQLRGPLGRIQNELFDVGADLCVPLEVEGRLRVEQAMVDRLEELCDGFNEIMPELKSFVLPGGTVASAGLHVARTVCRRAGRESSPPVSTTSIRSSRSTSTASPTSCSFLRARPTRSPAPTSPSGSPGVKVGDPPARSFAPHSDSG